MKWNEAVLTLKPYQPGKSTDEVKRNYGLEKIVKLASNENPFGCSDKVKERIKEFSKAFSIYPDGYATELRSAVAKFVGVKETELMFANGSDESIQIISRSLLGPGKNTVMATGTFSQYRHNAILDNAEVREVPNVDGEHDLDGMLAAIDENTAVVWICNPNNPTGKYIPEQKLRSFIEKVPQDVLIVLDEAYSQYAVAEDFPRTNNWHTEYKNIIVLRTFSKIYGLASLRVGYGIANEEIIRKIEPARPPFNVNTLGQMAALTALEDQEFIEKCRAENRKGMEQYHKFCQEENIPYYPSQGNFIFMHFKQDADEVFQNLLEQGFIARSGKGFGFPTSIRVTIGSEEENAGMIAAIKKYLNTTTAKSSASSQS